MNYENTDKYDNDNGAALDQGNEVARVAWVRVEILKITQNSFPVQPNCRQPQRCTAPLFESYPRIVQVEKWELTNEIWKVNIEKWKLTTEIWKVGVDKYKVEK